MKSELVDCDQGDEARKSYNPANLSETHSNDNLTVKQI